MKPRFWMPLNILAVFATLTIPTGYAAQSKHDHRSHKHHHYQLIDMGTFGGPESRIDYAIPLNNMGMVSGNNRRQVVGQSDLPGDTTHHAFLWTQEGGMQDLGTLNGQPVSLAFGINNQTQIVGIFEDFAGDNTTGFLWQDGVMTDLNTLIPPRSSLFIKEPVGINDREEIVGFGLLADGVTQRGFLLTPCDEHHPGVAGCDCSMVEAGTVPHTTPTKRETSSQIQLGPLLRNHLFGFRSRAINRGIN
jgi:probable HAF family extracellular repeat protein